MSTSQPTWGELDQKDWQELVELLHQYGFAKFRDEWWPGNAASWLGEERAQRLSCLLART